jgi:tetratricopeptide (TPR) repeat protein
MEWGDMHAGARIIVAALAMAAVPCGPSRGEDSPAWKACVNEAKAAPDVQISGCSEVIRSGRESSKNLAIAFNNRGNGFHAKKQYDRAIEDYDEAIRLDPNFALAYNNRGDTRMHQNDLDRAIADFSAAIRINPKYVPAYGNRAHAYKIKGDTARAIADYTTVIALHPTAEAYLDRGNAFRDLNQLDRAIADYSVIVDKAPDDARGWRNRGLVRLMKDDAAGAIADYDKAIRRDPNDAYSYNNRGMALLLAQQIDRAIADFDAALRLDAKPNMHAFRGDALRLKGDRAGAIAAYRAALALQPDNEHAREGLEQLGAKP